MGRQWDERLYIWDNAFTSNIFLPLMNIELSGFTCMEQLSLEKAGKKTFRPFPVGTKWGKKWEYGWFKTTVKVPASANGKRLVISLGAGPEMLVYVNGVAKGSIDKKHSYVCLTECAKKGETFNIVAEVYAGHGPRLEDGGIYPREVVPVPEAPECQCTIGNSKVYIFDNDIFEVYMDFHTLYGLYKALPEKSLRKMKILEGLQRFTNLADFEADLEERKDIIVNAGKVLKPLLAVHNGDTTVDYTVFGQSHLDLAWLWTKDETKRKCARTYSNQLALMEKYPGYKFLLCEPPILEYLKEYYPEMFERVKEKVATGDIIPEGGMYVESDTNIPSGESLIRQFVLGKKWFREELGAESKMAWMPDTFGYSGALPQIMAGCGIEYFATQKLLRADPETEQFPFNIFWWEGIDGTKILSHIYKKNNAQFTPEGLIDRWEKDRNQQENIDSFMFPFGFGDGGGGATEEMLETYERCRNLEGLPVCNMESPVAFFEKLDSKEVDNTYFGELYLAWHRGTYTAQSKIKKLMRQSEMAIRRAEYLCSLLRIERKPNKEAETVIAGLWKKLLFNQFHDILPGTGIEKVNEEAEEELSYILKNATELAEQLLGQFGSDVIFNSLSVSRNYKGTILKPCSMVKTGEKNTTELTAATAHGTISLEKLTGRETCEHAGVLKVKNDFYEAVIDAEGSIVSLKDSHTGYEYVKTAFNKIKMYRNVNGCYDAWELGAMYEDNEEELKGKVTITGKKLGTDIYITVEREEKHFNYRQTIIFYAETARIDIVLEVDWDERHKLLKTEFDTSIFTKEMLTETQFGYLKRPTHKSRQYERDQYEVSQQRYAVLTDGAYGIAILNDSKYGISARDGKMALSLLRAPVIPDMHADLGRHVISYAIYPFMGSFADSDVLAQAMCFNDAVIDTRITQGPLRAGEEKVFFELKDTFENVKSHVIIDTLKPAFDDDNVVARLYEYAGSSSACELVLPEKVKSVSVCNMLEEELEKVEVLSNRVKLNFRPFEIKTLKLYL